MKLPFALSLSFVRYGTWYTILRQMASTCDDHVIQLSVSVQGMKIIPWTNEKDETRVKKIQHSAHRQKKAESDLSYIQLVISTVLLVLFENLYKCLKAFSIARLQICHRMVLLLQQSLCTELVRLVKRTSLQFRNEFPHGISHISKDALQARSLRCFVNRVHDIAMVDR